MVHARAGRVRNRHGREAARLPQPLGGDASFHNIYAPRLRFEEYFRTVHRMAKSGEITSGADPKSALRVRVLMAEYQDTIRATVTARTAVRALVFVERLLGMRPG